MRGHSATSNGNPTPPTTGSGVAPPANAPTLWDQYATAAVTGTIPFPGTLSGSANKSPEAIARFSADVADAMMAERKKRGIV